MIISRGKDIVLPYVAHTMAMEDISDGAEFTIGRDRDHYVGMKVIGVVDELQRVLSMVTNGYVVYGGTSLVWGYADDGCYDHGVSGVCSHLQCSSLLRFLKADIPEATLRI